MCWTICYFMIILYCYCCVPPMLYVCHFSISSSSFNFHCSLVSMVDIINLRADYLFDDCRLVFISIKFNFSLFICLLVLNKNLLKKALTHRVANNGRIQPTYNLSWSFYLIFLWFYSSSRPRHFLLLSLSLSMCSFLCRSKSQ